MLDRNKRIKPRPERFQTSNDKFDILITCEERVYDQVIEGISNLFILQYNPFIFGSWI
jgi:RNA polymerase II subunit A C-terminal domain phosphatase SSU72